MDLPTEEEELDQRINSPKPGSVVFKNTIKQASLCETDMCIHNDFKTEDLRYRILCAVRLKNRLQKRSTWAVRRLN